MDMNRPAPPNAIDENTHGWIGKDLDRVDGRLKATGAAPYAYEVKEGAQPAYGWIVEATIGKGRVRSIATDEAERMPGVLLALTHRNAPRQARFTLDAEERFARPWPQLDDDEVAYYGEPVAFVVAQTLEQARAAARCVRIDYEPQPAEFDLHARLQLGSGLFIGRRHHAAGAAPGRPEIDQHRQLAARDVPFEVGRTQVGRMAGEQRLVATAAVGALAQVRGLDTVGGVAMRTHDVQLAHDGCGVSFSRLDTGGRHWCKSLEARL